MADKVAEKKETVAPEVVEKEVKDAEPSADEEETEKSTNGDAAENGDANEAEEKKEDEADNKKEEKDSTDGKACTIKRKSAGGGGDAPEDTPAEGATPEKKAKLSTEAESNGKPAAEVKA